MSERRIVVSVQHFGDRPQLMLQWHDPVTGKRKSQSAGTCNPLDAEKARADLEYELNHGLHKQSARMSWERFREVFEAEYVAPLRENTRDVYAATFDAFERLCDPSRLDLVTARTVSAFAAGLRTLKAGRREGLKASSVKVRLQFLHTALAWAAEQGLLAKVPKFPRVKVPDRKPRPVPAESFERLLAKAPDDNMRAYLLCGWLAGLRLDEAYRLEWEATEQAPYLDLAQDHIVLPAGFAKADRDQWVPLDPALREVLLALPRHGRRVFRFVDLRTGRGEIGVGSVSDRVIALAKRAGVKLTMHTLRKGFGCRYAGKVPAQVLQKLMRHSSIKTTMDFYANVDDAVMEAVIGTRRNGSRNTAPPSHGPAGTGNGATANVAESSGPTGSGR
jgi:integrase